MVSFYALKILASMAPSSSIVAGNVKILATNVDDTQMMGIAYENHISNFLNNLRGSYLVVMARNQNIDGH